MKNRRNYYRVLHIQPDAPAAVIRTSYKTIMQKLKAHPDLGGDGEQARFINEAYSVLSDPGKRRGYDRQYRPWNRSDNRNESAPGQTSSTPKPKPPRSAHGRRRYRCSMCGMINIFESILMETCVCRRCRTPLSKNNSGQQHGCKRQAKRIRQQGNVQLFSQHGNQGIHCSIQDISPQGMRFQSDVPIKKGITIRIECKTINALARVTHCTRSKSHPNKFEVGSRFKKIHASFMAGTFVSDVI